MAGFELVDPGVVWVPLWRPDAPHLVEGAEKLVFVCGMGQLA
jgi:hypothetical protein